MYYHNVGTQGVRNFFVNIMVSLFLQRVIFVEFWKIYIPTYLLNTMGSWIVRNSIYDNRTYFLDKLKSQMSEKLVSTAFHQKMKQIF